MKIAKQVSGFLSGAILAALTMTAKGIFSADDPVLRLLCVCDGLSVSGILLLCTAAMIWISDQGSFDILGYAFRKGLHHILPGRFGEDTGSYYDYKTRKQEKAHSSAVKLLLIPGAFYLAAGSVLAVIWGNMQG